MCSDQGWVAAERLIVAGTPLHVDLGQLFAQLDTPSQP